MTDPFDGWGHAPLDPAHAGAASDHVEVWSGGHAIGHLDTDLFGHVHHHAHPGDLGEHHTRTDLFGTEHHVNHHGLELGTSRSDLFGTVHHHDALGMETAHTRVDLFGVAHHLDARGVELATSHTDLSGRVHVEPSPESGHSPFASPGSFLDVLLGRR